MRSGLPAIVVSVDVDKRNEPLTFAVRGSQDSGRQDSNLRPSAPHAGDARSQGGTAAVLVNGAEAGCTAGCTANAGNERAGAAGSSPVDAAKAATAAGQPSDFAASLTMIATLPLTDAEKAEAVRRLLTGAQA